MKKLLLSLLLLNSWLLADSILVLKKGWQLVGVSSNISSMSDFDHGSVEQVWHFDASTQKWLGYSPDTSIQTKMNDNNITQLSSLKSWHGFWVKSKEEWTLVLKDSSLSTAPLDENRSQDTIQLKTGWNLISLPVDTVVSPNIFEDMTVWKYNSSDTWELFDANQSSETFPSLGHIKNSEGIWVKAPKDTNISIVDEALKLHNFKTVDEMESYIKERVTIYERPYCGIEPFIPSIALDTVTTEATADIAFVASEDGSATNTTSTNLQESDVDESDILKHNGKYIFYTTKRDTQNNPINITSFSHLASAQTEVINKIEFEDKRYIDSLYIKENKLIVLSYLYNPSLRTQVDIFDFSDINNIQTISSTKIDGSLVTSRLINTNLYLVTNFSPQISIEYPKVVQEVSNVCKEYLNGNASEDNYEAYIPCFYLQKDENGNYFSYDYENPKVTITQLLPEIKNNTASKQNLILPSRLYASSKQQQSATMTSISQIDISDGTYKQSNSFMGYSSVQYASSNAFYLVSNEYPIFYDFNNYKHRSVIYKFDFDTTLNYKGVGSVYGHALNQFSLSEHNDILRLATTEGFSWGSNGTNNSIYTLKEENSLLKTQGVLSGLGKEGETIQSVRFIGDKGYVVTFRQTDPLYTLDLSNPEAPTKVGELEVNGYSAYLHPVSDDLLLGVGRDADSEGRLKGVKLELFDISDFANPTSLQSITLADNTHSELEFNHKALAYRNSDKLFAFPYRSYENYQSSNALGIFQIQNNALVSHEAISTTVTNGWGQHRGLIFDMNNTTYVSFFAGDSVTTKTLNQND